MSSVICVRCVVFFCYCTYRKELSRLTLSLVTSNWSIMQAGVVCLQCKNCVIHTWVLQRRVSYNRATIQMSVPLPFQVQLWNMKREKPDDFLEDIDRDVWHTTDQLFQVLRSDERQQRDRYDGCHAVTYSVHLYQPPVQGKVLVR